MRTLGSQPYQARTRWAMNEVGLHDLGGDIVYQSSEVQWITVSFTSAVEKQEGSRHKHPSLCVPWTALCSPLVYFNPAPILFLICTSLLNYYGSSHLICNSTELIDQIAGHPVLLPLWVTLSGKCWQVKNFFSVSILGARQGFQLPFALILSRWVSPSFPQGWDYRCFRAEIDAAQKPSLHCYNVPLGDSCLFVSYVCAPARP